MYVPGLSILGHVSRGVAKLMMKGRTEERREGRRGERGGEEGRGGQRRGERGGEEGREGKSVDGRVN